MVLISKHETTCLTQLRLYCNTIICCHTVTTSKVFSHRHHLIISVLWIRCFSALGIYELMRDNRTVSGQTINAVERLSLYPELITSLLYRITGSQVSAPPRDNLFPLIKKIWHELVVFDCMATCVSWRAAYPHPAVLSPIKMLVMYSVCVWLVGFPPPCRM